VGWIVSGTLVSVLENPDNGPAHDLQLHQVRQRSHQADLRSPVSESRVGAGDGNDRPRSTHGAPNGQVRHPRHAKAVRR
jgi:hypothetical protein